MMNYEVFKAKVVEKFMDYMPEQYKNMRLEVHSVNKVNVTLDGMNLVGDDTLTPTIYINNMYEHYQETNDLQEALQVAASKMVDAMKEASEIASVIDINTAKDNIVFQLVNTEQNKEMLQNMPHRSFQDLSIIYRWIIKMDAGHIQSSMIFNAFAEKLEVSEEQLFKLAIENTRRILPPTVKSMNDVLLNDGMPREIVDLMIGEMPLEPTMWVIGNDRGINGAISMLYEDNLHSLAEKIGTDLYIMPSSIHEIIAVSTSTGDPNKLAQMVSEINKDQVPLNDRLSNQVYHYDKELRKLSIATAVPTEIA